MRLIDSCITELTAQGPFRTCNESKEERIIRIPDRTDAAPTGTGTPPAWSGENISHLCRLRISGHFGRARPDTFLTVFALRIQGGKFRV